MMIRKLALTAAATTLLPASAAATTLPARAATPAALSGQVALQGLVIGSSGSNVAGARVMLYAWPANWQPSHAGEQVPMRLVGEAVSSSGGAFALQISSPTALEASAGPGGIVDLQTGVAGATGSGGFYALPVKITRTASGLRLGGLWGQRIPRVVLRIGTIGPADFCYRRTVQYLHDFKREWGNIDATYMRKSGTSAWADYQDSQSTTFSVGVDSGGRYSAGGSMSLTASYGFDYRPNAGPSSEYYQTEFIPAKYEVLWQPGSCFGGYFAQPRRQTGGNRVQYRVRIPRTASRNCAAEFPGTWNVSKTAAFTFGAGLHIPEIGFTASAQTGWSSTDSLHFRHNRGNWTLCGVKDLPSGAPGALVAQ